MSKSDILIVTNMLDPHSDVIINKLGQLGESVIRLNTNYIPKDVEFRLDLNESSDYFEIRISKNNRKIKSNNIKSIWWRRPEPFNSKFIENSNKRRFFDREMSSIWRGIWADFDCYWISHPDDISRADVKISQLRRAIRLGFNIPPTIITNLWNTVNEFREVNNKSIIYKVIRDNFLGIPFNSEEDIGDPNNLKIGRTVVVDDQDMLLIPEIDLIWSQYQRKINKKFEYRITIFGEKVFSVRLNTQKISTSLIDWRDSQGIIECELIELPIDINNKCLEIVKSYNLNYGAIDLIETTDGDFIFLELNASGQYMWLEDRIKSSIMTDYLCKLLISGGNFEC